MLSYRRPYTLGPLRPNLSNSRLRRSTGGMGDASGG